jgi:hypothetical protein
MGGAERCRVCALVESSIGEPVDVDDPAEVDGREVRGNDLTVEANATANGGRAAIERCVVAPSSLAFVRASGEIGDAVFAAAANIAALLVERGFITVRVNANGGR